MNDDSPLVDALDLAEQIVDVDLRVHTFDAVQQAAAAVALAEQLTALEDLGMMLATLDEAHRAATWAVKQRVLALLAYGGEVTVGDVGTMTVKTPSPKVRYDNPRLLSVLAARVSDKVVDPLTGEIPPLAVIVEQVAQQVAAATGTGVPSFTGWRTGVLMQHGIDRSDYELSKEWSDAAVSLRIDRKARA